MSIQEIKILKKIIQIQSSIIEGHNIKAILRKETRFFIDEGGADIIAVCIKNEEHVEIELILEEKQKFLTLLRKYKLLPKHMNLNRFIEQCHNHFAKSQDHIQIERMYDIFQGTLSMKRSNDFEKELGFKGGELIPLRTKAGKKIGFMIYIFSKDVPIDDKKLLQLTEIFEVLIRPFYDEKRHVLHAKCVQVDEQMHRLTEKEKQIAQLVMLGKTHKVIAEEVDISLNTLKTHMKNIFSKYGVNSKIELHNMLAGNF